MESVLGHPFLKLIGAFVAAAWLGFDWAFQLLVIGMCIDIVSGMVKAYKLHKLSSSYSRDGILKKLGILLLILLVEAMERYGADRIGLVVPSLVGTNIPLSELAAIWFVKGEAISVVENLAAVGVNLPWLTDALAKIGDSAPAPQGR